MSDFKQRLQIFLKKQNLYLPINATLAELETLLKSQIANLNNIGQVCLNNKDYYAALKAFMEAAECSKELGDEKYIALNLWWVANAYSDNDKPKEALTNAEEVLALYRKMNLPNEVKRVEKFINNEKIIQASGKPKSLLQAEAEAKKVEKFINDDRIIQASGILRLDERLRKREEEEEKKREEEERNRDKNEIQRQLAIYNYEVQKRLAEYIFDKHDKGDPDAFQIIEKYRFIRDDVFLFAVANKATHTLHLEFHKKNLVSGLTEIFDELQCIHTVLIKIPYDKYADLMKNPEQNQKFATDMYRMDGESDGTEISLSFKQEIFAFKSWVQGIAEAGLNALKIQSEIDSLTHALPIAQFIAKNLIRVDPSYLMEFLTKIEKECRFEGNYHLPSLRANLIIALEAISQLDLFKEMSINLDYNSEDFYNPERRKRDPYYKMAYWQGEDLYYTPIDEKALNEIIECMRFIAELDSDFLANYENSRIKRFLKLC